MSAPKNIVIVGASLAGAKAAETLREEGYEGRLTLIGDEPERPYERPPLSKDYLRGEAGTDKVFVHEAGFYDDRSIELLTETRVSAIDPRAANRHRGGEGAAVGPAAPRRRCGAAQAAAGGRGPRRGVVPAQPGDSDRLRDVFRAGGRLVVVGGGWIGSEAAASARMLGLEVTVLERLAVPLENVLGPTVGQLYADLHREEGVEL